MMTESKPSNLGRGLSTLLGEPESAQPTAESERAPKTLPVEFLHPGKYQPRRHMDEERIRELAQSIGEQGVLQPLLVRRHPDEPNDFEIIAGERRWRAAQLARLHEVPVIIKDLSDPEALEIALVENLQRQDLSPLEEAEGYQRLMDEFGHTQEVLAAGVGKSRSHVANMMRLLNLPGPVKAMLDSGELSSGHARALLNAPDPSEVARRVINDNLNVRQTERLVRKVVRQGGLKKPAPAVDPDTKNLERSLSEKIGLNVAIRPKQGKGGAVIIKYADLDQLDGLVTRLTRKERTSSTEPAKESRPAAPKAANPKTDPEPEKKKPSSKASDQKPKSSKDPSSSSSKKSSSSSGSSSSSRSSSSSTSSKPKPKEPEPDPDPGSGKKSKPVKKAARAKEPAAKSPTETVAAAPPPKKDPQRAKSKPAPVTAPSSKKPTPEKKKPESKPEKDETPPPKKTKSEKPKSTSKPEKIEKPSTKTKTPETPKSKPADAVEVSKKEPKSEKSPPETKPEKKEKSSSKDQKSDQKKTKPEKDTKASPVGKEPVKTKPKSSDKAKQTPKEKTRKEPVSSSKSKSEPTEKASKPAKKEENKDPKGKPEKSNSAKKDKPTAKIKEPSKGKSTSRKKAGPPRPQKDARTGNTDGQEETENFRKSAGHTRFRGRTHGGQTHARGPRRHLCHRREGLRSKLHGPSLT